MVFDTALAWLQGLPDCVSWLVAGSIGVLLLTLTWWAVRYASYTRQHLSVQRKLVSESEAARLEDRRREAERVLSADDQVRRHDEIEPRYGQPPTRAKNTSQPMPTPRLCCHVTPSSPSAQAMAAFSEGGVVVTAHRLETVPLASTLA